MIMLAGCARLRDVRSAAGLDSGGLAAGRLEGSSASELMQ